MTLRSVPKPRPTPKKPPKRLPPVNPKRAKQALAEDYAGEYAAWVRAQGCLVEGRLINLELAGEARKRHHCARPVAAHHVVTRGAGGHAEGNLVPLCYLAHMQFHTWGRRTFEYRYGGIRLRALAAEYWTLYLQQRTV